MKSLIDDSKILGFCVYTILCRSNGRIYVGESGNVYHRLCGHKAKLRNGTHPLQALSEDFKRYGEDAFSFRIEGKYDTRTDARNAEADLIASCVERGSVYNIRVPYSFGCLPEESSNFDDCLTAKSIADELKGMAKEAASQKLLALRLGFPDSLISSVINGARKPPKSMLEKLGYEAVIEYRRKS